MREPLKDKNRLEHILDAIEIISQRTSGMSFEDFTADKVVYGGIVYYTMIIGEAAYKLSREFIEAHSEVSWQDIADMRHHLVHGYYQVDSRIVWDVIQHDLNPLHEQIKKLLSETDWEQWEKK
jgi:uncharacterized protein with HEPN domain